MFLRGTIAHGIAMLARVAGSWEMGSSLFIRMNPDKNLSGLLTRTLASGGMGLVRERAPYVVDSRYTTEEDEHEELGQGRGGSPPSPTYAERR